MILVDVLHQDPGMFGIVSFQPGSWWQIISQNYGKFTKKSYRNHTKINYLKNKLHFCFVHIYNKLNIIQTSIGALNFLLKKKAKSFFSRF